MVRLYTSSVSRRVQRSGQENNTTVYGNKNKYKFKGLYRNYGNENTKIKTCDRTTQRSLLNRVEIGLHDALPKIVSDVVFQSTYRTHRTNPYKEKNLVTKGSIAQKRWFRSCPKRTLKKVFNGPCGFVLGQSQLSSHTSSRVICPPPISWFPCR